MLSADFHTEQSARSMARYLRAFVIITALYVIGVRLYIAADAPLWLDETWSAMIATRQDWSTFWREAWLDVNPPLYYLFLTTWVSLFGESNLALRLPSILFVISAAALPMLWRPHGLNRTGAWTLAALIILWPPGLYVMTDARGYGLIVLLSTMSCLVLNQMLERLTPQRTAAWVLLGTMMFLTHYFAAVLIVGQIFILLYRHRTGLLRMWPAVIVAVPGIAWFAYHLPRLQDYSRADVVWQQYATAESALANLTFIFGATNVISLGVLAGILLILYDREPKSDGAVAAPHSDQNLVLVTASAAIAFGIAITIGIFQASLISRYLVPLVPPAMLGIVLITQRCTRSELAGILIAFTFLLPALNAKQSKSFVVERAMYGYEEGSHFVNSYNPDQLLFIWDHPAAKILDQHSLERIGGYFMNRELSDIQVQSLTVPETADANVILRAAAQGERPAVIWLYNTADRTAARHYPPTFESDPAWTCRDRDSDTARSRALGAIACVKLEKTSD